MPEQSPFDEKIMQAHQLIRMRDVHKLSALIKSIPFGSERRAFQDLFYKKHGYKIIDWAMNLKDWEDYNRVYLALNQK
ncbi:MAG TPA: hypothetical protein ACFCUD_13410 [Cyclobacteriaceae bacterium]